ncbi:hypothetical protein OAX78_01965 [Planctomycetota bacterium]|nr:hypothetical protein [Planctomycetota bacterium]
MSERERERVKVPGDRCPYCHDEVERSASDKLACNECMAWHHSSCWQEHGSCAACGANRTGVATGTPLVPTRAVGGRLHRPPGLWIAGPLLIFLVPLLTWLAVWAYNDNVQTVAGSTGENLIGFAFLVGAALGVGCMLLALKRHSDKILAEPSDGLKENLGSDSKSKSDGTADG